MISGMTGTHDCNAILERETDPDGNLKPVDETLKPANENERALLHSFDEATANASNFAVNRTLQQKSTQKAPKNGMTIDDAIDLISDGDLSSVHEDGEISEGLSDIYR